jgi:hypothetical protein
MIYAASHQVIRLAIAFNSTSCSFIIRSISAAEYCRVWVTPTASQTAALKADRSCVNSTGQITC